VNAAGDHWLRHPLPTRPMATLVPPWTSSTWAARRHVWSRATGRRFVHPPRW